MDTDARADNFIRYETVSPVQGPIGMVGVAIELEVPSGVVAMDNILLWETTPPCFDACED